MYQFYRRYTNVLIGVVINNEPRKSITPRKKLIVSSMIKLFNLISDYSFYILLLFNFSVIITCIYKASVGGHTLMKLLKLFCDYFLHSLSSLNIAVVLISIRKAKLVGEYTYILICLLELMVFWRTTVWLKNYRKTPSLLRLDDARE